MALRGGPPQVPWRRSEGRCLHPEDSAETVCMDREPRKRIYRPSTAACHFDGCVYPRAGTPHPCPESGCGPHDQGQSCPPKAPRVYLVNEGTLDERPFREDGQADQSGDVSSRGRSSHSSPSTGKPCTW